MNAELIRFIDSISRDKKIEKESIFLDLEAAIHSAVRRAYDENADIAVLIDRASGDISATVDEEPVDMKMLGRIAAQTAKQVMIQKLREDERNSLFDEYSTRVGTVVTGSVARYEGGSLIVNLGRGEGILPRSEQIPGEAHHPGERIRAMILDVREEKNLVRIVLTQTHPDYIRRLFELEVPEVGERTIEIRALAREAGYRTKVAVSSIDAKVDAVGACVGVRGSRIRNIVDELGGEKIDIVRWNESSQILIANSLKPAEIEETFLCFELGRGTVIVAEDQLSLAIGKRGQNVRLAARLTGWDIDILTPAEYNKALDDMERTLSTIESVEDVLLDKLLAIGIISLHDIAEIGTEPLVSALGLEEELATRIVQASGEAAAKIAQETEAAKVLAASQAAAAAAAAAEEVETSATEAAEEEAAAVEAEAGPTDTAEGAAEGAETSATEAAEEEAAVVEAEVGPTDTAEGAAEGAETSATEAAEEEAAVVEAEAGPTDTAEEEQEQAAVSPEAVLGETSPATGEDVVDSAASLAPLAEEAAAAEGEAALSTEAFSGGSGEDCPGEAKDVIDAVDK